MRRLAFVAAIGAGAILGGGGIAIAQSDTNIINACTNTTTGAVRVTEEPCRTSETALSWNQQGVAGPAGPAGPQGPAGPAGPAGEGGGDLVIVTATEAVPVAGENVARATVTVDCPEGTSVTGGGWGFVPATSEGSPGAWRVFTSEPVGDSAWQMTFGRSAPQGTTLANGTFTGYARCASLS